MEYTGKEARVRKRSYIEPYDTGTYLLFNLNGMNYKFNLADISPGGMGMLVKDNDSEILEQISIGDRIRMEYTTPEASVAIDFGIKHMTPIENGRFKGHHQVGLSLISDQG